MRRVLVLTNEASRHPFRQHLLLEETSVPIITRTKPVKREVSDLAFFGLSFTCFFVLIMGMIV